MSASHRLIVSILAIVAIAIAFWMLLLGPKREEASSLAGQVEEQRLALSEAQVKASEAAAARREFPNDYRRLVVLGQAVPADDETASLLVELNRIADTSGVQFKSIQLGNSGESAAAPEAPAAAAAAPTSAAGVPASATVPPTEAAASVMPLGASVGPAGLAVMPYNLTFSGNFFSVAKFIRGIDSLIDTGDGEVLVDGRLVTLDSFALNAAAEGGFPQLNATFSVTTYLTPPSQGITAGATPTAPAPSVATPASASVPAEPAEPEASSEAVPASDAQ